MRQFRLSPPGDARGVCCDANGAYVDSIPLLKRVNNGAPWEARDCEELSADFSSRFGLPIDVTAKAAGLAAIARALNAGEVARAQLIALFLRFPSPPPLAKSVSRSELIEFIRALYWSGLIKADWDPTKHPRWPAGAPESQGGRFTRPGTSAAEPGIGHNQGPPLEDEEAAAPEEAAELGPFAAALALAGPILLSTTVPAGTGEDEALEQVKERINKHHSWPKYLGGAPNQPLTEMTESQHIQYHRELDEIARRRNGTKFFEDMSVAQKEKLFEEIAKLTKDFDAKNGTRLYDDMLKNKFSVPQ